MMLDKAALLESSDDKLISDNVGVNELRTSNNNAALGFTFTTSFKVDEDVKSSIQQQPRDVKSSIVIQDGMFINHDLFALPDVIKHTKTSSKVGAVGAAVARHSPTPPTVRASCGGVGNSSSASYSPINNRRQRQQSD